MSEEKEFEYVNPFDGYGELKTDSLYPKILFTTDEINKYDLIGQLEQLQRENRQLREKCEKQKYAITENCDLRKEILKLESVLDEIREYIKTHVKEHIHDNYDVTLYYSLNQDECDELLEILREE